MLFRSSPTSLSALKLVKLDDLIAGLNPPFFCSFRFGKGRVTSSSPHRTERGFEVAELTLVELRRREVGGRRAVDESAGEVCGEGREEEEEEEEILNQLSLSFPFVELALLLFVFCLGKTTPSEGGAPWLFFDLATGRWEPP